MSVVTSSPSPCGAPDHHGADKARAEPPHYSVVTTGAGPRRERTLATATVRGRTAVAAISHDRELERPLADVNHMVSPGHIRSECESPWR